MKEKITKKKQWKELKEHYLKTKDMHIKELFEKNSDRFEKFSIHFEEMLFDFSKNKITEKTLNLLIKFAESSNLKTHIEAMFKGEKINWTEKWAALHVALRNRSNAPILYEGKDVMPDVNNALKEVELFSEKIRSGKHKGYTGKKIKNIISIGIGGSFLGPMMISEALKPYAKNDIDIRFIANIDGSDFVEQTKGIDPEETLFVVVSKSFTTQETLTNAESAKQWILDSLKDKKSIKYHFIALSTNIKKAVEFGISKENIFGFWDWVGGRYSWASCISLPVACYIGYENFIQMLEGAHAMDVHFRKTPFKQNIPVILALIGIWYINFYKAETHAILPYDEYLKYLPSYLQQLDMESNGKYIDKDGNEVDYSTGPIIWGSTGTNGQHSFFQLIHQGTKLIPADFIGFINPHHNKKDHHNKLMANFFAQPEALMTGKAKNEVKKELLSKNMESDEVERLAPHRAFKGNRPTNTILFRKLTPKNLGMIISMYEMKTFVQGIIWRINSFDQWGVELGKQLSGKILTELRDDDIKNSELSHHDPSTKALLQHFMSNYKLK